ncbi:hypothetical protein BGZ65_010290, partial [Modicella reniformis]
MRWCGIHDKAVQQAWREKFTLCFIILLIGCTVAFMTLGFTYFLCPISQPQTFVRFNNTAYNGFYGVNGTIFDFTKAKLTGFDPKVLMPGGDVSNIFIRNNIPSCQGLTSAAARFDNCDKEAGGCLAGHAGSKEYLQSIGAVASNDLKAGYDWEQMAVVNLMNFIVINGNVLNLNAYFRKNKNPIPGDELDAVLRHLRNREKPEGGRDATKLFFRKESLKGSASCLVDKFGAGFIDKASPGCFAADLFMYVATTVVMGIVLSRFAMAIIFDWFIAAKLARPPSKSKVHAMASAASSNSNLSGSTIAAPSPGKPLSRSPTGSSVSVGNPLELHTVMLVTCYSEGESSLRTTIESLAATEYPDNKKLLFIICDGIITGSAKQYNRAKVYAGYFRWKNRRVPTVLIVKCGGEEEQDKPKAGNRGKRDSQLILMNFFMRVTYNDRMTPLDFELFRKIQHLMQVTPDKFEIVLMVDADTKVYPSSLRLLMNCMNNDPLIMGLCGETKIANKRQSWVTAIQVFEYYISHHLGKGFESIFGGVT